MDRIVSGERSPYDLEMQKPRLPAATHSTFLGGLASFNNSSNEISSYSAGGAAGATGGINLANISVGDSGSAEGLLLKN